jgi:hypothetical protein
MAKLLSFLTKFEPQLAAIWRWSLIVSNASGSRFAFNVNTETRLTKGMYKNVQKFWATNSGHYLHEALATYFQLRVKWIERGNRQDPVLSKVSGWADDATWSKLENSLQDSKLRRRFRPDVWYLRDGEVGLFQGFNFTASQIAVEKALSILEGAASNQPQSNKIGFRIDSIDACESETDPTWQTAFQISPKQFTFLVEAACDAEIAKLAIEQLSLQNLNQLTSDKIRSLVTFHLVSQTRPETLSVGGWERKEIVEPDWVSVTPTALHQGERSKVPERYFNKDNVQVTNGGIITHGNYFLDWDKAQHPSLDFVAGNTELVIGTSANNKSCYIRTTRVEKTIATGILLSSRCDSNWFHFLIETLPRLLLVDDMTPQNIPVLVSSRIPKTAKEALALVSRREVIELDETTVTLVLKAIVPGPVIYHPDTQYLWGDDASENINLITLRRMREMILRQLSTSQKAVFTYWPRFSRHRTLLNSRQVETALKARQFTVQNPGELSFLGQVESIQSSSKIVAVGGALMSNFIFAKPGSKIIVLVSDFGRAYPWPRLLAQVSDGIVTVVGGRRYGHSSIETLIEKSHASFATRIRELKIALSKK